jgi:autotransporter-associated beta strand protein
LNNWYCVTATWGSGGEDFYINGVLAGTNSYNGPAPDGVCDLIGSSSWPQSGINGQIEQVSVYEQPMSASQVGAIYAAGPKGMAQPYYFSSGSGTWSSMWSPSPPPSNSTVVVRGNSSVFINQRDVQVTNFSVQAGSSLTIQGSASLDVNGTLFNQGTLTLSGSVNGDLVFGDNATALLQSTCAAPPPMYVGGNLTFGDSAVLNIAGPGRAAPVPGNYPLFVVNGTIESLPTWTINQPQGWTFGSVVASGNELLLLNLEPPQVPWTAAASGSWSGSGNWTGSVPNSAGAGAAFTAPTTASVVATLDEPVTLGSLQLDSGGNANAGYTLSGGGSNKLTLNNSGSGASIMVVSGSHAINAPVVLEDNLTVASGGLDTSWVLSFGTAGIAQSGSGRYSLTMNGAGGTLILSGSDNYSGGTFVTAGTLIVTDPSAIADGTNLTVGDPMAFSPCESTDPAAATVSVPEPGAAALLCCGMVSLGCGWTRAACRRRRGLKS